MTPTLSGALVGTGLAAAIAIAAWRAGSLSRSGAAAALVTGAVSMSAGFAWGLFLVVWFVSASLASKLGRRTKEAATGDVVAKGGARDAAQVLANGGIYAACALTSMPLAHPTVAIVGAAALIAAGADTLATETGTLWRGQPWSLRTLGPVPTGTSGAVSLPGTLGMVVGAIGLATVAMGIGLVPRDAVVTVAAAGFAGATADTVIGAFWQARRWCPQCERETEQNVHRCGTMTRPWRGLSWLSNDFVNFLCTVVGAATAWIIVGGSGAR